MGIVKAPEIRSIPMVRIRPLPYHGAMWRRRFVTIAKLLLVFGAFTAVAAPEWPAFQDERHQLNAIVELRDFDFLVWFLDALAAKGSERAGLGHAYLEHETRKEIVLTYLEYVRDARRLEGEINSLYADPDIDDPEAASASLRNKRAQARAQMKRLQPLAEAIVQEHVSAVLADEGFELLGGVLPPVQMHMTALPLILIVSPRDEIHQLYGVPLVPGLTTREMELLETAVYERLDRSALVVPIGGLGFFPAMIVETSNVNFLADVVAHEWAHHWLTLRPLGIRYLADPELRTINETVASLLGSEIGARVIERFYPEFVPPETPDVAPSQEAEPSPDKTPSFDFRAEMAATRVRVDKLLAAGRVEEAEAYMEKRRRLFVANGYPIRKLNQAYFAFYGAYADTPGAAGDDPIGPAVLALRENSPSLHAFMTTVASVTSAEELNAALAAARSEN